MPCRFNGVRRPFRSRAVSFCSRVSVFVRACALIIIYAYVRTYGARTYNNARLVTPMHRSLTRIIKCALSARLIENASAYRSVSFSCRFVAVFVSLARHGTERKLQLFIDLYCKPNTVIVMYMYPILLPKGQYTCSCTCTVKLCVNMSPPPQQPSPNSK